MSVCVCVRARRELGGYPLTLSLSLSLARYLSLRASLTVAHVAGEAVLPVIDLSGGGGAGDFSNWVKASPSSNLVYEAFGKMRIARCVTKSVKSV